MITRAIRRTRLRRMRLLGPDAAACSRTRSWPAAPPSDPSSLHELLLYSAVCGTGLDTVPLPEDVSEAELAGAYLDVAALSVALNGKPLTARLLPVPGARAGDADDVHVRLLLQHARAAERWRRAPRGVLARGQMKLLTTLLIALLAALACTRPADASCLRCSVGAIVYVVLLFGRLVLSAAASPIAGKTWSGRCSSCWSPGSSCGWSARRTNSASAVADAVA